MSEKKARLRRRSLRRSQENSRLQQKAAAVVRGQHEREFDRLIAGARKDRADAVKAAQAKLEADIKAAHAKAKQAIQDAETAYLERRDKIVHDAAAAEAKAA